MSGDRSATVVENATAEWERVLRAYAASLQEHRAVLTAIEADTVADAPVHAPAEFIPPSELPLLPEALRPWARSLLEATDGLSACAARLSSRAQLQVSARPARVSAPVRSRWEASL